jgi:hypothetical protein
VVVISGKATFHAGANLKMLSQGIDLEMACESCSHLHQPFLQLENLGISPVAAINGHCMGGGYEFALAMTRYHDRGQDTADRGHRSVANRCGGRCGWFFGERSNGPVRDWFYSL